MRRFTACYDEAICFCKYGEFPLSTRRCVSKLDRILSHGRSAQKPYSGWTLQDLEAAVKQRGLFLPKKLNERALLRTIKQDDTQRQFRFMDLPAELRLRVYEFTLGERLEYDMARPRNGEGMVKPALLRVSRQIRQEASQTFFRQNCFVIRSNADRTSDRSESDSIPLESTNRWLESLSSADLADMRSISIFMRERVQIDLTLPGPEGWLFEVAREPYVCSCSLNDRLSLADLSQRFAYRQNTSLKVLSNTSLKALFIAKIYSGLTKSVNEAAAEFKALCGDGDQVKPNIKGLKILVAAAGRVMRNRPVCTFYCETAPPSKPFRACWNVSRGYH